MTVFFGADGLRQVANGRSHREAMSMRKWLKRIDHWKKVRVAIGCQVLVLSLTLPECSRWLILVCVLVLGNCAILKGGSDAIHLNIYRLAMYSFTNTLPSSSLPSPIYEERITTTLFYLAVAGLCSCEASVCIRKLSCVKKASCSICQALQCSFRCLSLSLSVDA